MFAAAFESKPTSFGTSLFPRAIPTMAVMCVSVPNTCMDSPKLEPTKEYVTNEELINEPKHKARKSARLTAQRYVTDVDVYYRYFTAVTTMISSGGWIYM